MQEFNEKIESLIGDIVLSVAMIIYCGPLEPNWRQSFLETCKKCCRKYEIKFGENFR